MVSSDELIQGITDIVGPRGILTVDTDLLPHEIDWRHIFRGKSFCAARPDSTQQVSELVRFCRRNGLTIVPQGGNTGLAGGAVPDASGRQVLLLTSRLSKIRSVDPVGMAITAEAGCVLKQAQDAALLANRLLPVSLASEGSATIGGIVASNAGGVNVLRYGMSRSLVLGLEVVLSDGTIVDGLRSLRKDNAGFDWKQVFIGSEGALGIVTAAVLRLMPKPLHRVVALVAVATPGAALELLSRCYDAVGDQVSAFELISELSLRLVEKHLGLKSPVSGGAWFVLVELTSSIPGLIEAAEVMLAGALESGLALNGTIAASDTQAAQLWALRENITEAEGREGKSIKHDVSVPLDAIPKFIAQAVLAVATHWPAAQVNAFGHAGDGNIHFNVIAAAVEEPGAVNRLIHDIVAQYDGSISAEHGIGQYRVDELKHYRSKAEFDLGVLLKRSLDPGNMLNPGKVVRLDP